MNFAFCPLFLFLLCQAATSSYSPARLATFRKIHDEAMVTLKNGSQFKVQDEGKFMWNLASLAEETLNVEEMRPMLSSTVEMIAKGLKKWPNTGDMLVVQQLITRLIPVSFPDACLLVDAIVDNSVAGLEKLLDEPTVPQMCAAVTKKDMAQFLETLEFILIKARPFVTDDLKAIIELCERALKSPDHVLHYESIIKILFLVLRYDYDNVSKDIDGEVVDILISLPGIIRKVIGNLSEVRGMALELSFLVLTRVADRTPDALLQNGLLSFYDHVLPRTMKKRPDGKVRKPVDYSLNTYLLPGSCHLFYRMILVDPEVIERVKGRKLFKRLVFGRLPRTKDVNIIKANLHRVLADQMKGNQLSYSTYDMLHRLLHAYQRAQYGMDHEDLPVIIQTLLQFNAVDSARFRRACKDWDFPGKQGNGAKAIVPLVPRIKDAKSLLGAILAEESLLDPALRRPLQMIADQLPG